MRVAGGEPGVECQIDFAQMGVFRCLKTRESACADFHCRVFQSYVCLAHPYANAGSGHCRVRNGIAVFRGICKVLIPDNLKPVVTTADPVNPRFTVGWFDYARHARFGTDPARVSGYSRISEPPVFRFRATRYWESEPPNILVQSQTSPFLVSGGLEDASHLDANPPFHFGSSAHRTHIVPFGVYSERVEDSMSMHISDTADTPCSSASFRLDCWQRLQARVLLGLFV